MPIKELDKRLSEVERVAAQLWVNRATTTEQVNEKVAVTTAQAEQTASTRHRYHQRRLQAFGVLLVIAFATQAFTSVMQNNKLAAYAKDQCLQRQHNVELGNARNSALAEIEANNQFVDQTIRDKRVAIYKAGMLVMPNC